MLFVIVISLLLLAAFVFDISSDAIKVPSVILLLALGWVVHQGAKFFGADIPNLEPILPVIGTVGLILIVMEGSLELKLSKSKVNFILKVVSISLLSIVVFSGLATWVLVEYFGIEPRIAVINSIPFSIISSAIAIPSVSSFTAKNKEFVIYESSLSDIFGVILFNFFALNEEITNHTFGVFTLEILTILILTLVCTLGLAFLLKKIDHHVKFLPILLVVVLIYAVSKYFHLPALIFILLFGLYLGNFEKVGELGFLSKIEPEKFKDEIKKFKEITIEFAFLIRASFFLLFGYLLDAEELLNIQTMGFSVSIVIAIFVIRFIVLKLFKIDLLPVTFVAPRGLITILLFVSIPKHERIVFFNESLVSQVILMTAFVMMFGLFFKRKEATNDLEIVHENESNEDIEQDFKD